MSLRENLLMAILLAGVVTLSLPVAGVAQDRGTEVDLQEIGRQLREAVGRGEITVSRGCRCPRQGDAS